MEQEEHNHNEHFYEIMFTIVLIYSIVITILYIEEYKSNPLNNPLIQSVLDIFR